MHTETAGDLESTEVAGHVGSGRSTTGKESRCPESGRKEGEEDEDCDVNTARTEREITKEEETG